MRSNNLERSLSQKAGRLLILLLAVAISLWAIIITGRLGLSRMFVTYGMATRNFLAANEAVHLSSSDAEAHYTRAVLLRVSGFANESVAELERAVALRPRDYVFWLELGMTREELNDEQGALAAMNESVRLAPYYANPRWQRGNLLLRMHRYGEAFDDLRLAARSNPDLMPGLIDLAWGFSQSQPSVAQELGELNTPEMHFLFALYLARRNRAIDAVEQFKSAGTVSAEKKSELVSALLEKRNFAEAYQVWSVNRNAGQSSAIYDGSFEGALTFDESGFGWRIPKNLQGAQLTLDTTLCFEGAKCLRIEFTGESAPETPVLSQLFVVEPNRKYEVTFNVKSETVITGGVPVISITDASDKKPLGQPTRLVIDASGWQSQTISFISPETSRAAILSVQREGCPNAPCPAFGTLWLDGFNLKSFENR